MSDELSDEEIDTAVCAALRSGRMDWMAATTVGGVIDAVVITDAAAEAYEIAPWLRSVAAGLEPSEQVCSGCHSSEYTRMSAEGAQYRAQQRIASGAMQLAYVRESAGDAAAAVHMSADEHPQAIAAWLRRAADEIETWAPPDRFDGGCLGCQCAWCGGPLDDA